MNLNISTDSELLKNLIEQFELYEDLDPETQPKSLDRNQLHDTLLNILENLENLIHQIDNAQLFADLGGYILLHFYT